MNGYKCFHAKSKGCVEVFAITSLHAQQKALELFKKKLPHRLAMKIKQEDICVYLCEVNGKPYMNAVS